MCTGPRGGDDGGSGFAEKESFRVQQRAVEGDIEREGENIL